MSDTKHENEYKCRGSTVVLRLVKVSYIGRIAVGQQSTESIRFQVKAKGPKVENLEIGDWVMAKGQLKVDYDFLIGEKDLVAIDEKNIALVIVSKNKSEDAVVCKNCGEWYPADHKRPECRLCSHKMVLKS